MKIQIEVSPGELLDRISILQLKAASITDAIKLSNVRHELALQQATREAAIPPDEQLLRLERQLCQINLQLWQIEDDLRACEAAGDFGPRFVALARAVYLSNDQRSALKRQINVLLGSVIVEEKSYHDYQSSAASFGAAPP